MMKDAIIIGIAVVGLLTLGADYFFLEQFATGDISEARVKLWTTTGITYLVLLIPPFIMSNSSRREAAGDFISAAGFAGLAIAKWVGIGFMICLGFYLANYVFQLS